MTVQKHERLVSVNEAFNNTASTPEAPCSPNITAPQHILSDPLFPGNEVHLFFSSTILPCYNAPVFSGKNTADLKQTQPLVAHEPVARVTHVLWDDALEKNKSNKSTYFSRGEAKKTF